MTSIEKLNTFLKNSIGPQLPMRIRFFNLCTLGGTVGALLATIAPLISGVYSTIGLIACLAIMLFFLGLFIATCITKKYDRCIVAGVIGLNFVIYPILYFTMGGIEGGMVLYFIMGIVFSLMLLTLKESLIIFPLEIIGYSLIFALGEAQPYRFIPINVAAYKYTLDTALDFMVVSITTFFVIKLLYNAYETQLKKSEALVKELEELSITDPLTKLRNRRFLMQELELEFVKSKRENYPVSAIMFDIDKFKSINDTYGHLVGDDVLKNFARILHDNCREYDTVARYGGEEFVILLPRTDSSVAYGRAESIRAAVEDSHLTNMVEVKVTASGGLAQLDHSKMKSVDDFMSIIDNYLYEAKENGRNTIVQ